MNITKETSMTEIMDEFERVALKSFLPYAGMVKTATESDLEPEVIARNLLGKIGVRIVFGKTLTDKVLFKET